jgi:hypothetical protein
MTELAELVRAELTTLADTGTPSTDLADRAVAAGIRRSRRRYATMGGAAVAAVAAVALAATQVLVPQTRQPDPRPAAPEPRNVVFATFTDGAVTVLDPSTGAYRTPQVSLVMHPSDDLRYAPVLPVVPEDTPNTSALNRRAGRYDTVTGDIRWFDLPRRWSAPPTISPDGRYLAAPVVTAASTGIVVVDTTDGTIGEFDVSADTVAALDVIVGTVSLDGNPPKVQPRGYPDIPLTWRPDSRHVLFGTAVVDLTGRRTGTLPMPDAWLIAPRPNGAGTLFVPKDRLDSLGLTDAGGTVEAGATLDWTCGNQAPTVCPSVFFNGFLGWRGDRQIVVMSPDGPGGIDAVDVRTGTRTRVTTHDARRVLVTPADRLAPAVRDAVSF